MGCAALGHPKQCLSIPAAVPAGVTSASPAGRNHANAAADGTGGDGPPRRGIPGFVGSVGRRAGSTTGRGRAKRRDDPGTHVGGQVGPRRHEAGQVGVGRAVARWPPSCAPFGPRCGQRCARRCALFGIGVFSRRFRECSGVQFPPAPLTITPPARGGGGGRPGSAMGHGPSAIGHRLPTILPRFRPGEVASPRAGGGGGGGGQWRSGRVPKGKGQRANRQSTKSASSSPVSQRGRCRVLEAEGANAPNTPHPLRFELFPI
jgi:hypothetical protein